ncbi:MAG: proprotein convertase P-domain-containing protein [Planctomycetota bacterium]|nr:proprotein convertase P-domain-containing protein [Planctomycetota bacterium]
MMISRSRAAACLAAVAGLAGFNTAYGQQYTSSPSLAIPDSVGPSVQDTITVTGGPTSIMDMAVTINITHTWDADLDIVLVRNGQTLHLTSDNGGSGDNFVDTRFIDAAATSITTGAAPFTGDYRPEGGNPGWTGTIVIPGVFLADLAGFNGQDANGAWDLVIDDDAGGDVGTLNSWTLDFDPVPPPPPPPPPPNDACADAEPVGDGAFAFDTTTATPEGPGACGASAASPDVFFLWTPTTTGCGVIETCGSGFDTVLEVLSVCGTSLNCNDDACGLQSRIELPSVTAGTPILVRVSGFNAAAGAGTVTFTSSPSTPYTPPGSGTTEAEACGNDPDTINAGCNSTPPSYLPIACGETIIGTTFVIPNTTRDTDWFSFTLGATDSVTVTGQAQIPVNAYIMRVNDCATFDITILATGNNTSCNPGFTATAADLPAGDYVFFIASTNFTNVAVCGTGTENWWATLTFGNGCGGAPCDPDVNQDGNVDQDDIACLAQAVAGNPGCLGGGVDPDFNQDGNVDQDDISTLEQVVAGSPCP